MAKVQAQRPTAAQKLAWQALSPLAWAVAVRPQIPHPIKGIVRIAPYQYQAQFWADRSPARVVLKARQTGFSQAIALEAAHTAQFRPASTVLFVSRNMDAAINVLRYVKLSLQTPGIDARLVKDNETEAELANGSRVLSIPATKGAGRTYAATSVYLDEFAWAEWAQQIYAAVAPTVSQGGRITVLSTPNGRVNAFYLLWAGQWGKDFSKHVVPWWRCPAYNPDGWQIADDAESRAVGTVGVWYQAERPKFTVQQWAQEYGCDFTDSGQAVFRAIDIERAQQQSTGLQVALPKHKYISFWDIGRRHDATVGTTIDISIEPWQVVAFERAEGLPYPAIQKAIEDRYRAYPGRHWVESNGVGDPVIENLSVPVEAWLTTARSKQQMIQALQLQLERGSLAWPATLIQLTAEMLLYQWDDAKLIQDCVMSLAGSVAVSNQPRNDNVLEFYRREQATNGGTHVAA